ncbi:hypothetical protein AB0F92_20590 [Kitasatospora aureofaciens]|uniref:hypothetical protein n=1 Tax=Kitasatospora aureofaciens TaxID=1894 RepID=UPI0033EE22F5
MVRTDLAVDPDAVTAAVAAVVEGADAHERAAAVAAEIAAMPAPATVVEQLAGEAAAYSTGVPS